MEGDAGASESGDSCYQSRSDDRAVECTEVREWDSGAVKSSIAPFTVESWVSFPINHLGRFYRSRTMKTSWPTPRFNKKPHQW